MVIEEIANHSNFSIVGNDDGCWKIDAEGIPYKKLNSILRGLNGKARRIEIQNVYGQRYIGTDLQGNVEISIVGTPGNDLGAFLNGPTLIVDGNVQDGLGNTMNEGRIIVHGHAGDIIGYSMRGGRIFIRDDVGYRVGIHMKEYFDKKPYIVVGGTAQDFLGEYMAGGILVVLGLDLKLGEKHLARFVGTGMHGGKMLIRGEVTSLGKEVEKVELDKEDRIILKSLVDEFCTYFGFDPTSILESEFYKLMPVSSRPYGRLYSY